MAMEPITIYSQHVDPRGVIAVLRSRNIPVAIDGRADAQQAEPRLDWREARIMIPRSGGWSSLAFRHDREYYLSSGFRRQMLGMADYLADFPESPFKSRVLQLVEGFRFALATSWEPELESPDDPRLPYLLAVSDYLDGLLFTPSALRDPHGRLLLSADGHYDREAAPPSLAEPASDASEIDPLRDLGDDDSDRHDSYHLDGEPEPPLPQQVAARALVLAVVTARAMLEQEDPTAPWVRKTHRSNLDWVEAVGIGEEFESEEWSVLQAPLGTLDPQSQINAVWRLEGLAVLAWALQRFDLPPDDRLVDVRPLWDSLGLHDADRAGRLLVEPALRSEAELAALQHHLLGLHWRLREFSLRPHEMNFRETARNFWAGPLDMRRFRLIENDLAIEDYPLGRAPEELVRRTQSSAQERHLAINWLLLGGTYSETDTST